MKRILICGDVHWSQYSSIVRRRGDKYSQRLENLIKSVQWVEDMATSHKCDEVLYLGDFWDRPDANAEEITAIQEVKWANTNHKFLIGNHESNVLNLEYSSTKMFESINAEIIDTHRVYKVGGVDLVYVPYITTDKVLSLKDYCTFSNKKSVIFAHQDIAGVQYGRFKTTAGFDVNEINNSEVLYIGGHLHNHSMIGNNLILVGNLTGQNFNEDASLYEHLIYIMEIDDEDRINLDYYVNPYAMCFYKIRVSNESDLNKLYNLKDNSVLSITCNHKYVKQVDKIVRSSPKVMEYRTAVYYDVTYNSEEGSNEEFIVDDHLKQFIDFSRSKLEHTSILDDELSRLEGK